jgi:membrane-associated phospholipid phosphatase
VSSSETSGSVATRPVQRSHWWREILIVATFYGLYTLVRDLRGDEPVSYLRATTNAHRVISLERHLGLFHEANIQHWFLQYRELIRLCDDYYGTIHFVAAGAVLLLLFFRFPERYRLWRNTLAITTGLALIGFSFFPLLPPRLLPAGYGFVDTLKVIGGLWNFSSGPVNDVSNQYAAMPSLHTSWSAWCTLAVFPLVRSWWAKVLLVLYPLATIFIIVITANHYFADVAAGLLLLGVAYLLAVALTRRLDRHYARREADPTPSVAELAPTTRS